MPVNTNLTNVVGDYVPTSGGTVTGNLTINGILTSILGSASILASGSTNTNTLTIKANDTTFITLTTAATDTCEIDNTTLDTCVGKGTWTASGTWTLPAFTLGSSVVSAGKAITTAVDTTSYVVLALNSLTSGYGSFLQFTDNTTYNYSFGANVTTGDFAWWSGRYAANAGTERMRLSQAGLLTFPSSKDSALVVDEVSISGYEISAGNRALAISQESAVLVDVDETKFSHKLPVRINGVTYYMMLTAT